MRDIALRVNGRPLAVVAEPRQHLADWLREELLLTGTHLGCEHGVCGACTVLIDGVPARSCIAFPVALEGSAITTIEGLADDAVMVRLREAFAAEHGLQCGFCTPGMLIMARDIVLRRPGADAAAIRHELAGNLCRCTGYVGIVRAVERVAAAQRDDPAAIGEAAAIAPSPLALPVAPRQMASTAPPPIAAAASPSPAGDSDDTDEPLRNPVTLVQSFTVAASRAAVWALFQDPARVVACLPGARLTAPSDGRTLAAALAVKLGPIQASFEGAGRLAAEPATWSGVITGRGVDRRSFSRVQGRLSYRLAADGEGTRVEADIAYVLQGPLAQMSRGALARDLAGRMTETFASRLAATLGDTAPPAAAPLDAGSMLGAMLRDWWRRVMRRG